MNIEMIGNQSANRMVDVDKNQYGTHLSEDSRMRTSGMGYSLDITGKVKENAAYGKEDLKSAQEIAQAAGMQDVSIQRNYMAVMSNSMSSEDFAELIKDGVDPTETRVTESVTNLDKIKIKMAEAGIEIVGFNDDLTAEDYEAASANPEIAKAVETAKKLSPINEDTLSYMIGNNLDPTIENIYKAEHSIANVEGIEKSTVKYDGAATYASRSQTDIAWEELADKAMSIVQESDVDLEEGMKAAKWLVENQIPLNSDTLEKYVLLTNTEIPTEDKDILNAVENALIDGKSPMEADFSKDKNIYEEAVQIVKDFAELEIDGDITAKRQLEEIRLAMTCEANLVLLRKGISIDTKNLEKLVDMLKEAEREFYAPLLMSDSDAVNQKNLQAEDILSNSQLTADKTINPDNADNHENRTGSLNDFNSSDAELDAKIALYKSTVSLIKEIPEIPVEAIANASYNSDNNNFDKLFSLHDLNASGTELSRAYENAGKSYESLMTAPRADMGDSISKAFSNVDDILTDLDMDLNDANRKAVRTLGYANMPINRESIDGIREVTMTVSRVISLMTPQKTLELIREGHNPLNDNIYDLEKTLSEGNPEESAKKYSRYLVELERKGDITPEEKSAYIGMYRLFNLIEKQDGRVIGNVLSTGQDLTMQNMLSAARSNRHKNMDVKIDDDFGLLDELIIKDESITEQISKGFTEMLSTPFNKEYVDEKLNDIRKASKADPEITQILQNISEPVSVENILAFEDMMTSFDKGVKKLFGKEDKTDKDSDDNITSEDYLADEDAFELVDNFTDRNAARKAYEDFIGKAEAVTREGMEKSENSVDVKQWMLIHKQLGFASSMSRKDSYEIPVKTKGGYTSIHLTVKHGSTSNGKVEASMETAEYGRLTARFSLSADGVDGFIVSDSRQGIDNIKSKKADIISELEKEGISTKDISFVFGKVTKAGEYDFDNSNVEDNITDQQLYQVAKAFVVAVGQ